MSSSSKTDPIVAAAPGLGLDAGGTQTRWALADGQGGPIAEGSAGGFSGLQLATAQGRAEVAAVLAAIRQALPLPPRAVCAGVTGFDGDADGPLAGVIAEAFGVPVGHVRLFNDIELACRAAFAPGEGYLVYAGTGSVAAFIDEAGEQHRAGGRGGLIDDGGSGYWIAREALRRVWRAEDEEPGAWRRSPLAQRLFDAIGGSSWAATRSWVYGASRGQLGELALAVAQAAEQGDGAAVAILEAAGGELARLGQAMIKRHGPRPVRLAGRVFQLHPVIERALRAGLATVDVRSPSSLHAHRRAAHIAALGLAA